MFFAAKKKLKVVCSLGQRGAFNLGAVEGCSCAACGRCRVLSYKVQHRAGRCGQHEEQQLCCCAAVAN